MLLFDHKDKYFYFDYTMLEQTLGIVCTTLGHEQILANENYPKGVHPYNYLKVAKERSLKEFLLIFIIDGQGIFYSSKSGQVKVRKGDVLFISPEEKHYYYPNKSTGWESLWIGFKSPNLDKFFALENSPLNSLINMENFGYRLEHLFNELFMVASEQLSHFQIRLGGIIQDIITYIIYSSYNKISVENPLLEKIYQARSILLKDLNLSISLQKLSSDLGISYSLFRKNFKQILGVSPHQFIVKQRLLKAKELLLNSELNISEISYQVGFNSVNQLSSLFKQKEGLTPSEFRKRTIGY